MSTILFALAMLVQASSGLLVSAEWIRERLSSPKIDLLDARPDNEFTGADGGMGGRHVAGHLPDARQLVWNSLLDASGSFLPDAELKKKYEASGADHQTPLVSYCMVGMRASVTYFAARHLATTRGCTTVRSWTGPGASCRR